MYETYDSLTLLRIEDVSTHLFIFLCSRTADATTRQFHITFNFKKSHLSLSGHISHLTSFLENPSIFQKKMGTQKVQKPACKIKSDLIIKQNI